MARYRRPAAKATRPVEPLKASPLGPWNHVETAADKALREARRAAYEAKRPREIEWANTPDGEVF